MAFRNGPLSYMGKCCSVVARHPSGILVNPYELRMDGRYHRQDGVDLTSGRLSEGRTAVSGSKRSQAAFAPYTLCVNPYTGGAQNSGMPV